MTRVSIHSLELTPLEAEVLSEILAAKLEEHLANRAKYVGRKDSGPGPAIPAQEAEAGTPLPAKPAFSPGRRTWSSGAPLPPRGEPAPVDRLMVAGLRALVEGRLACEQPMAFVRIMFPASMAGLIETREAAYYLTDSGREAIR